MTGKVKAALAPMLKGKPDVQIDAASTNSNDNSDYALIKCIGRLVIDVLMKCWALSAAAVLAIFLIYCMCGGWLTLCLLLFAVAGE